LGIEHPERFAGNGSHAKSFLQKSNILVWGLDGQFRKSTQTRPKVSSYRRYQPFVQNAQVLKDERPEIRMTQGTHSID
jgi:hypothetical protein